MEALFVGTLDGVFKVARSNGGGWQVVSKELPGMEVNVLAVHSNKRKADDKNWN